VVADVVAAFLANRRSRGTESGGGLHAAVSQNWVLRFAEQYPIKRFSAFVVIMRGQARRNFLLTDYAGLGFAIWDVFADF
jgi:hypothetical protein